MSPVLFDDGRGKIQRVGTLKRSMIVGWSPNAHRAFLQNNWGSDIADCYILTRGSGGISGISLLKKIQRTPGRPSERPYYSHYYVRCDRWTSPSQIAGEVSGHIDKPYRDFSYSFIYDSQVGKITWIP
jgi:hypothetical protein